MAVQQAPLGVNQVEVLRCLREHGGWPGGWVWGKPSLTRKILDSLVRRGLVEVQPRWDPQRGFNYDYYVPKEQP